MAGTPGHTFQSFPGSLDGESVGKSTSSEPSVAAIFNSRFGANSSGNHRALETPEFFSWSLRNTRVYSGTLLLPLPPPSIDHNPGHCWLPWKISSVQFSCSVVSHSATQWTAARQASLSITSSRSLFKLTSIESVMPSNYLILCSPLLLLPSIFPSIRVFSNESVFPIRPKYWSSSSASVLPMNIQNFRIDWLDLLVVQGSLLQHHSSKPSILWCSVFFTVQLSHPYMTTRKTIALTRRTFVGKVMPLFFNMLSRLVIPFLPRSKRLNFMATVTICSDFGAQENNLSLFSIVSPSICQEVMGP